MEPTDHGQRQRPPPSKDFRDARSRSDQGLELLPRPAERLTARGDRFDWGERVNRKRTTLVRIDERREGVELALFARPALGVPKLLDPSKSLLVSGAIYYRFDHVSHTLLASTRSYSA